MNLLKITSGAVIMAMLSGCVTMEGAQGPRGPKLTGSGRTTEYGHYTEIGVEFSSVGDFVALVSPSRWKSPVRTGGSLSWINPAAWNEDPGRTSRILLGEVVMVGTAVAAGSSGGGGESGTTGTSSDEDISPIGPSGGPSSPPTYTPE